MNVLARVRPSTMEGQMIAILATSLVLLFGALTLIELLGRDSPIDWARSAHSLNRLERMRTTLESIEPVKRGAFLRKISQCHEGYTLSSAPRPTTVNAETAALRKTIAARFGLGERNVRAGEAILTRADFAYGACSATEISLPMNAVVVSVQLDTGNWLNTEIHPHEWHIEGLLSDLLRYGVAVVGIGALAIVFMHRVSRPLKTLTSAAQRFATGLHVSAVPEIGPPDVKRAIAAFNTMQRLVAEEVKKRIDMLTAISHDLRTPLTALRIKAELLDDEEKRTDVVASIDKMDRLIASAIQFLRGESRAEPLREIDLGAMVASECSEFEEAGGHAEYVGEGNVHYTCRSEALARAVRNLIENANKYAGGAVVDLQAHGDRVEITVADNGPGIPEREFATAMQPFRRLSSARGSHEGGFGLGLAIAEAITRGHGGVLLLSANTPTGLIVTIRLPR